MDEKKTGTVSLGELCRLLGKPPAYVRALQMRLGLYTPSAAEGYSGAYFAFLETIVALRTFSVPLDDIGELFEAEKKLLKLLKVDSLTMSKTWYLDACGSTDAAGTRLLLTRHSLEHAITDTGVQLHLDFSANAPELFSGTEMGEDVRRVLNRCVELRRKVVERVEAEEPVLEMALRWSGRALQG